MSEMIHKVALAIQAKAQERGYPAIPTPLVHFLAAAGIEAMLEPTVAMQRAGFEALEPSRDCDCDQKDVWAAMIDSALKD